MRPGRLDQLIYIPMPDYESVYLYSSCSSIILQCPRMLILHMWLHKLKFTGADLTEICQRAELRIREAIQRDMERNDKKEAEANDQVTEDDMEEEDLIAKHLKKQFVKREDQSVIVI